MNRGVIYWLSTCLIGSVLYSIFFTIEILPEPAFVRSLIDYLIHALIFFTISAIISLPIIFVMKKTSKLEFIKIKEITLNNIILIIVSILTLSISTKMMVSFTEGLTLTISYCLPSLFFTNLFIYNKNKTRKVYNIS